MSTTENAPGASVQPVGSAAWQPIETAPKDGTPVLLVWRWDSGLHTGTTIIMASWMCLKHAMLSSWHHCPNEPDCKMGWGNYVGKFSHWMLLPVPPNAEVSDSRREKP